MSVSIIRTNRLNCKLAHECPQLLLQNKCSSVVSVEQGEQKQEVSRLLNVKKKYHNRNTFDANLLGIKYCQVHLHQRITKCMEAIFLVLFRAMKITS